MQAFETTAQIDDAGQLHLDQPLPVHNQGARVVILLKEPADTADWLGSMTHNPSFAFLHDENETIYTAEDGVPITR